MTPLNLDKIKVFYDQDLRKVQCFCGEVRNRTIVPHLRKKHPEIWESWCKDFVDQLGQGKTPRQIMKRYSLSDGKLLFSWTVVERALHEIIESNKVKPVFLEKTKIEQWEPLGFKLERTTVWDFKERGDWAVHQNDYRGNWSPRLVRNLLLRYTKPKQWILDPFVGGGTTLIEAWLNGRRSLGVDISPFAVEMTSQRLTQLKNRSYEMKKRKLEDNFKPILEQGDSRDLLAIVQKNGITPGKFSLACVHPPYFNAFHYTQMQKGDLSRINNINKFCSDLQEIATSIFECLKNDGKCGVLIGDVRKKNRIVPLGFKVLNSFLNAGFQLKEIVIKVQHNDRSTEFWYTKDVDFLISHEYLFILDKGDQTCQPK
jgi:DNA modification methylase